MSLLLGARTSYRTPITSASVLETLLEPPKLSAGPLASALVGSVVTLSNSNRGSSAVNGSSYGGLVAPIDEEPTMTSWTNQEAYARFDRLLNNLQLSPQSSRPPHHLPMNGNCKQQRYKNNLQISPQTSRRPRLVYSNGNPPRNSSKSDTKPMPSVCNGATSKRYSTSGITGVEYNNGSCGGNNDQQTLSIDQCSNGTNTGGDTNATLDQLMGEFNFGVTGRKRNWGDCHGGKSIHEREWANQLVSPKSSTSYYWSSSNNSEPIWTRDSGGSGGAATTSSSSSSAAAIAMAKIEADRHSYRWLGDSTVVHHSSTNKSDDARDVGFWTNVFFNKNSAGGSPTSSSRNTSNGHRSSSSSGCNNSDSGGAQRKKSTTSILINQILNDNDDQASNGYMRQRDLSTAHNRDQHCRNNSGSGGGAMAIMSTHHDNLSPKHTITVGDSPSSSSSSSSRYNAFNVIKRKNNILTKTKISPNINGNHASTSSTSSSSSASNSNGGGGGNSSCSSSESERIAKTDLFLLPSANTSGRIYSALTDGNITLDEGHFMQVF